MVAGCGNPSLSHMRVPQGVAVPDRCAVVFFVDGLDHTIVDDMLNRDELPAIRRHLVDRGATVENAITCIPSITYAIQVTLLTGLYPGHHDILGNKWFERRSRIWKTYNEAETYREVNEDFAAKTVYEVLHDRLTVNFQSATRRGVTHTFDNWAESGVCWCFRWHLALDRWVGCNFEQIEGLARRTGRWPALIHAYFPGVDGRAHTVGSDSPLYRQALRNVDTQIGLACDGLARAGVLDRTYLLLVSDHGHTPCPRNQFVDVSEWLRDSRGWRVHEGRRTDDWSPERRRKHFERVDAACINGGNRQYLIHLRAPAGWEARPGFSQCKDALTAGNPPLYRLPAVFVGCCRKGPDSVWIVGREGEAVVTRRRHDNGSEYRYDVVHGDPLGYLAEPVAAECVRSGWHESRAWLDATAESRCPDVVAQLVEFFDSPRSPDIALFAADGWDFSPDNVGGHGSILRRDMLVTMVFAGPGVRPGHSLRTARTCDVAPTIVELLAGPGRVKDFGRIDGRSLVPELLTIERVAQAQTR